MKPSWVLQSVAKQKLAGPRQHSPDPSQYFSDVIVSCAELPEGDKDAIIAGVIALGGQYSGPLSKMVTHIVTQDDQHDKCELARAKKVRCKIVLPHWFDDCLRLGKKISERPYTFPDPDYLKTDSVRPPPGDAPSVAGATGAVPEVPKMPGTPPASPSDTRKNLNAFMGKRIYLSTDLELSEHILKTLQTLINHGGGTLTDDVDEADIYIGQYRDGEHYTAASRARKEVANLSWLYHVINKNKYTNPLSKLLHYPVPRNGVDGFQNMRISISNYNGDARIYLENLITFLGATFTKTMKQDNSHLITAHKRSEKYEAAQEWNINIANHLWIEESYAKCANQSLTNPRYTTFPDKTNLGEVCGQTPIDIKAVERVHFPEKFVSPRKPTQPTPTQKQRTALRKAVPVSSAVPTSGSPKEAVQAAAATPIAEDEEMEAEDPTEAPQTVKKARGRPKRSLTATPQLADGKENESPAMTSTGKRAANIKAADKLKINSEDWLLYEKERKRVGGVTHGGRRSSHLEEVSSPAPPPKRVGKRRSDENTYDVTAEGSDLSDGETQDKRAKASKKAKHSAAQAEFPPVEYKMMVTGEERWIGKPKQEDADKTKLRMLGVQLTEDAKDVDILVAPKILRTRKFVAALACAPLVVDTKYLDSALKHNKLLEKPSILRDRETEERLGFKLADALARAKINDRQLFRGWSIFVTRDVQGGFDTYKEIITLNGGEAYLYAGRTGLKLPPRRRREDPEAGEESQHQGDDDDYDCVYLVSGSTEADMKLRRLFKNNAEKQELTAKIVQTDWLLNAAMSQQIRRDAKWELE